MRKIYPGTALFSSCRLVILSLMLYQERMAALTKIIKRDGSVVAFNPEKISFAVYRAAVAVGGRDSEKAQALARRIVELLTESYSDDDPPSVENVQDAVEKVLIETGHAKVAKAYIIYRYEHELKRRKKDSLTYNRDNIPYKKLYQMLRWSAEQSLFKTQDLFQKMLQGNFASLIAESEEFYENEIGNAVGCLKDRQDDLRLVVIAGPSSSGKTTTTLRIAQGLESGGLSPVPLSVDNYFYDLQSHPRSPEGDYDFETPQAIDAELFNEHLKLLLEGKPVEVPYYNFKTGRREKSARSLRLAKNDILLLDCLHGFHEPLTQAVPSGEKFLVYIETLSCLRTTDSQDIAWTDIRLLRRMIRDRQFRGYSFLQTLNHWSTVRRSELRHIIAKLKSADVLVNSFLPYEFCVWKSVAGVGLHDLLQDPGVREGEARARLNRLVKLIDEIPQWDNHEIIPRNSVVREFLGGSILNVH
jgi:uridine kinase